MGIWKIDSLIGKLACARGEARVQSWSQSSRRVLLSAPGVVCSLSVVVFVALASYNITLPGLYYDELIQIVPAFAFTNGPLASAVSWAPETQVWLFGHGLSLMTLDYIGAVKTIAYMPVSAVFGVTPESVRYFTICIGALALLATFAFARVLFDSAVAAIAVLLLATDPSLVFYSRIDFGPTVIMMLTKAAGLWLLAIWWKSGQNSRLLMGCFCFGLGLYDKANFAWIIGGVGFAALIIAPYGLARRFSATRVGFASLGLLMGAAPLIWCNLSWPPRTIAAMWAINKPGAPSGGLAQQIVYRLGVLMDLLDGRQVTEWLGDGQAPLFPILTVLLGVVVLFVAIQYLKSSSRMATRPVAFVSLCGLLILVMAALTSGGFGHHHIILVYPFPHLAVAAAFVQSARALGRLLGKCSSSVFAIILYALLASPVIAHAVTVAAVFGELERTGGRGNWSDAIYNLNEYLLGQQPVAPVIVLDWGIYYNLVGLSQGRLRGVEFWPPLNNSSTSSDVLKDAFGHPCYRYILHSANVTNFPLPRERFFEAAKIGGLRVKLDRVFGSRDGKPVFEVYSVVGEMATSYHEKRALTLESGHASVLAVPNPVRVGVGDRAGITTISWNTGNGSLGRLYVSVNGQQESLFAEGANGIKDATWIRVGAAYEFRLYSATQHRRLLATLMVTRGFSCSDDEH